MSLITVHNTINGEPLPPITNEYIDSIDPATNQVIAKVPNSTQHDLELAVCAAKQAQAGWQALSISKRAVYLQKLSDQILTHIDKLAELESLDTGKPLAAAKTIDIPRAAENFSFFAKLSQTTSGEVFDMAELGFNYTNRQPLGTVACISPWNLPLYLLTWKIAPALLMGNCVIAKPSELTPLTADYFAKLCEAVELPPGVLNILHGTGSQIGEAIINHPDIAAISFTGGTETGKHIATTAGARLVKTSLELGGKNPSLIFADCDFNAMLDTTVRSSFANQGQICLCTSRLYVQKSIYEQFKKYFVTHVQELQVGDPLDKQTTQGAVISEQHFNKIMMHLDTAKSDGAQVLCGGERVKPNERCQNGFFIQPTVLEGLPTSHPFNQTEIFGPVVSLIPFEDESQAIQEANHSDFGLSAVIWTQDIHRAHRVAKQIQAGTLWVNQWMLRDLRTPFGGMKSSGIGREGGNQALNFFSEAQNICIGL